MKPLTFSITLTQHRRDNIRGLSIGEEENLSEGASFWDVDTDLRPIYENFNILSYFSPSVAIELYDIRKCEFKGKIINISQFSFGNKEQRYYLFQLYKESYKEIHRSKGQDKMKIRYSVANKLAWPSTTMNQIPFKIQNIEETNFINVDFEVLQKKPGGPDEQSIVITVEDQGGWILNNLYPLHHENRNKFGRISEKRRPTKRRNNFPEEKDQVDKLLQLPARLMLPQFSTDLQYFYIEPKSQREKVIGKKHIALALQGGGCKGVTYIGAYKAILDSYKDENIEITSVIGSSAGGIIGLAIACKIDPQRIVSLCQEYLSKVTDDKTYPKKDQKTEAMVNKYYGILQQVLREYNIVDEQVIEVCKNFLNDQVFTEYLFNVFKEKAGLAQNKGLLGLFQYQNKEKNYCGLLNGKLMTGEKVKDIARCCLKLMHEGRKFQKNMQTYLNSLKTSQSPKSWLDKITMKQLYLITGTEFTCTSVDITNHMLRFFNHKTTPDLPVVNAVQMTGAFPVAFQASYWKKQWGKYYIHYRNIRREVDLEGCKFTDGGMLANFPIDCIDNQDMRPMYFSHVKDQSTIMFGVGLNQCKNPPPPKQVQNPLTFTKILSIIGLKQLPSLLKQYLQSRFCCCKFLSICSSSQREQKDITDKVLLEKLREIPLFDFGFNLLVTYASTKDKLAEECFRHGSYQVQPGDSVIGYIEDREEAKKEVWNDIKSLREKIQEILDDCKKPNELEILTSNLKYLLNKPPPKTEDELLQIQNKLNIIFSKLMFNFLHVFTQPQTRQLLYKRVQQSYKNINPQPFPQSQSPQSLSPLQKLSKILSHKSSLTLQNSPKYKQLQSSTQTNPNTLKKYYFDRIFFELQLMRNCRLFVLCNLRRDYQVIRRIVQETVVIVGEVFDRGCKGELAVRVRGRSKEMGGNGDVFIPEEYLKYQRANQSQKFTKILQKLTPPPSHTPLKPHLQTCHQMLQQTLTHNTTTFKFLSTSPYNATHLHTLITLLHQIPQLHHHIPVIQECMEGGMEDNGDVGRCLGELEGIGVGVDCGVGREVFGSGGGSGGARRGRDGDIVRELVAVQECLVTCRIRDVEELNRRIANLKSCVELVITYETYTKRQNINSYIRRSIQSTRATNPNPQGFHIVMQSSPFSQSYLLNYLQILKGFTVNVSTNPYPNPNPNLNPKPNLNPNSNPNLNPSLHHLQSQHNYNYNLPITSITTSNIHSIAAVLYASDLGAGKIWKYCEEIKGVCYENSGEFVERIEKQLKSGDWAKKLPILLRDITTLYTHQPHPQNIFTQTQSTLSTSQSWPEFHQKMSTLSSTYQHQKQHLADLLEQSLNCVMDQVYRTDSNDHIEDRLDYVARRLALSYGGRSYGSQGDGGDFGDFLGFVDGVARKYVEFLKIAVETSEYAAQELVTNISKGQKKDAWKGMILGQIHTSLKIKLLVQQIMQQLNLTKDTTLQQFHKSYSKKITLNFAVITTQNNCIDIYNHYTRPYMPVWAAVLASSSLIQFFKPVSDRSKWSYQLLDDAEMRKIKKFFKDAGPSTYHLYSADSLRRLPIDLLTNGKMSEKIYNGQKKREVFLVFDYILKINYVKTLKKSQLNKNNRLILSIQNTNFKDLFKISRLNLKPQQILSIPSVQQSSKKMSLYIDSHDKLIINLYRKQLIMLPIRLGTVDFHLMCVPGEDRLSDLSNDSIMQSYFVMREKIRNRRGIQDAKGGLGGQGGLGEGVVRKVLYFRVEDWGREVNQPKGVAVRFLSRLVPTKHYKQQYKLEYKQSQQQPYLSLTDQYLPLKSPPKNLHLKITYVQLQPQPQPPQTTQFNQNNPTKLLQKLRTKYFKLDLSKFRTVADRFGYVYCLEYGKGMQGELRPEDGFNGGYENDYIFKREKLEGDKDKDRDRESQVVFRQSQESIRMDNSENVSLMSPAWRKSTNQRSKLKPIEFSKNTKIPMITIPITLQKSPQSPEPQTPLCQHSHPLTLQTTQLPHKFFHSSLQSQSPSLTPFYQCQTCLTQNNPKTSYTIAQKYQIKLDKNNQIYCAFDHQVVYRRRFSSYPLAVDLARCDKCQDCIGLGYFEDVGCGVYLCGGCVDGMVRDQL